MKSNDVIEVMMNRKSTRRYKPQMPEREVIESIVKAGQQAPFASQLYSVILCTDGKFAFNAPISFIICLDAHKLQMFMSKRGWKIKTNKLTLLLLGLPMVELVMGYPDEEAHIRPRYPMSFTMFENTYQESGDNGPNPQMISLMCCVNAASA